MKLIIVGAAGSMSGPESAASCYLVQARGHDPNTGAERTYSIAMDLGPGSFGQLWRHIDPGDVDALLITHGHADHMADIISFYVFLKWHPDGPRRAQFVAAPAEVFSRALQIDGYTSSAEMAQHFDFQAVTAGTQLTVGPMRVTAFPGEHPVESYGFRIEGPSESASGESVTIAYTGDSDACTGMARMAEGVDVLLSECGFTDADLPRGIHMSGTRAGRIADDAGVGRLVLTHIQPWTDPSIPVAEAREQFAGPIDVARPGMEWAV